MTENKIYVIDIDDFNLTYMKTLTYIVHVVERFSDKAIYLASSNKGHKCIYVAMVL